MTVQSIQMLDIKLPLAGIKYTTTYISKANNGINANRGLNAAQSDQIAFTSNNVSEQAPSVVIAGTKINHSLLSSIEWNGFSELYSL